MRGRMYMNKCISIYIYAYVHMYICRKVYMYICIYVYMYTCIYVEMYGPLLRHADPFKHCKNQCETCFLLVGFRLIFGCSFRLLDFWIFRFLDFWIFGFLDIWIFAVFFGGFVFCLFVVLCFWCTFAVCNVFFRVLRTQSDFRCTEKAEFTDYWYEY